MDNDDDALTLNETLRELGTVEDAIQDFNFRVAELEYNTSIARLAGVAPGPDRLAWGNECIARYKRLCDRKRNGLESYLRRLLSNN